MKSKLFTPHKPIHNSLHKSLHKPFHKSFQNLFPHLFHRHLRHLCLVLSVIMSFQWSSAAAAAHHKANHYKVDLCIYGATSAGIMAAYAAKKCGLSVLVLGADKMIGGMTTGGLGQTDIGHKEAITGLAHQFYEKVGARYDKAESWQFEPSVALEVFQDYIHTAEIDVFLNTVLRKAKKKGNKIRSLVLKQWKGNSKTIIHVEAKVFMDCTYEGDLLAKAGVSYTVGREGNLQYNETLNGYQLASYHKRSGYHQFPDSVSAFKKPGDPASGLVWGVSHSKSRKSGTGDKQVQAYNFRICLTDSAANRIPITRPADYDSNRYILLARLFKAQPDMRKINNYFIWSRMPNHKTDINNRGGFSTDIIGQNYHWPEASYKQRNRLYQEAVSYTKGLLYFMQTDPRVPDSLRAFIQNWGYPKDEYREFGHFTPQLYVREGRRMIGAYVMTEHNCRGQKVVQDGIGLASYGIDSHNTERIALNGMVKNEGNVEVPVSGPYPISYSAIVPKSEECSNLIVPVCLSASHIAYGSIRMEPVFMVLGQSAAMAASLAIKHTTSVQQIDVKQLQNWLKKDPYLNNQSNQGNQNNPAK